MRICLIASSRFPVAEPFQGGLEAHTATLADRLMQRGHEVTLFAAPGSDPRFGARVLPVSRHRSSAIARRDVAAPPEVWMQEHHAYLALMLELMRDGDRYDVVHNNSLHHLPIAMAAAISPPLVTTLHTPPLPWIESAARLAPPGVRHVAVSRHTRAAWCHVVDATVIPNGVDTASWVPGPGGERAVWSGRLVPEKAPHLAIDAARAAGLAIDLVGPVQDHEYVAREVLPRLGPDVVHHGHLGGVELVRMIGSAAVAVVSPTWDEPYGLVAAEALACGTPVAAFARGALPEIVDDSCGALAAPDEVEALARAVGIAAGRDRHAARRRAETLCDVDRMVDSYETLYRELAGLEAVA